MTGSNLKAFNSTADKRVPFERLTVINRNSPWFCAVETLPGTKRKGVNHLLIVNIVIDGVTEGSPFSVPNHHFTSLHFLKVKESHLNHYHILYFILTWWDSRFNHYLNWKEFCGCDAFTSHLFISSGYILENAGSPPSGSNHSAPVGQTLGTQIFSPKHLTHLEVFNALSCINPIKSTGADQLATRLLLLAAPFLVECLNF